MLKANKIKLQHPLISLFDIALIKRRQQLSTSIYTSISFSKKIAIFQHLFKVGCCLLAESTEDI